MMRTLALAVAVVALADASTRASAEPMRIEPGVALELECDTKSIVVAEQRFQTSDGRSRLRLLVAADAGEPHMGRWWSLATSAGHAAGFAALHKEACRDGCPLVARPGSRIELWAPVRAAFDQVPDEQLLTLAALDPDKLTLRISTFKAKAVYALEEGQCRRP